MTMNKQEKKLNFIKKLSAEKYRSPARVRAELISAIQNGDDVNNKKFSDDMKLGIFYGLLWSFGYDYDEAMKLARELVKIDG